ncbi:TFIIB-type zinc ribbon-containing protein [Candidatus Saccharibacteria bacterium]|nr:TFIIB-type zinc ribbon-containing protein [Candidatus Saccharibacteria bacterium]
MVPTGENLVRRCPFCGASEVDFLADQGKLRCKSCKRVFEGEKANELGGVEELSQVVIGEGAHKIVQNAETVLTLQCSSCGAKVIIDTNEALSAKCHWCRHVLSVNEQVPNGAVPDLVLPFQIGRDEAKRKIGEFVGKRKFFAKRWFKKDFNLEEVRGVYLPYMIIDANMSVRLNGEAEKMSFAYFVPSKKGDGFELRYRAKVFDVAREFDLLVDDLVIEASLEKMNQDIQKNTNHVLNAVMPFDTENCVKWDARYLKGYACEYRDMDVEKIMPIAKMQIGDVARYAMLGTLKKYNRGVCWEATNIEAKGERWRAAYLPVWIYSYTEKTKGGGEKVHIIAVNGRTGEIAGSVPSSRVWIMTIAWAITILMIVLLFWSVAMTGKRELLMLVIPVMLLGSVLYGVGINLVRERYNFISTRHRHEYDTHMKVDNLKSWDHYRAKRGGQSNARIEGENAAMVRGNLANVMDSHEESAFEGALACLEFFGFDKLIWGKK